MSDRISQAELDVMEIIWDRAPIAATGVAEALAVKKDWNIRTVKTLLARLVEKNVLSTEKEGRRFLYRPLIDRQTYVGGAATSLVDRLFGGRAAPLVAQLAERKTLTTEDIAELEAIIQDLKS